MLLGNGRNLASFDIDSLHSFSDAPYGDSVVSESITRMVEDDSSSIVSQSQGVIGSQYGFGPGLEFPQSDGVLITTDTAVVTIPVSEQQFHIEEHSASAVQGADDVLFSVVSVVVDELSTVTE